jgi:ankyrin repeat protein
MASAEPEPEDDLGGAAPVQSEEMAAAVKDGNAEAVAAMLGAGQSTEARSKVGETSLHQAARAGISVVVQALVEAGADVDCGDKAGTTPPRPTPSPHHTPSCPLLSRPESGV